MGKQEHKNSFSEVTTEPIMVQPLHASDGQLVPCLMVITGPQMGKYYPLEKPELVIGRAPDSDIYLPETSVSRYHAKLLVDQERGFSIHDLDSTNGTFLNGSRIANGKLNEGDTLQLGKATLLKLEHLSKVEGTFHTQLYKAGTRDPLTGLYNRLYLDEHLDADFQLAVRHREELSLLMFDIDHFKLVNDTFGHLSGDTVLRMVGLILGQSLRSEDIAARYGGEEFVLVLRRTSLEGALTAARRICGAIRARPTRFQDLEVPISASVGIATLTHNPLSFPDSQAFFLAADKALYLAKEGGRDRIEVAAMNRRG